MSNILIEGNNLYKVYDQDVYLHRGINFYALSGVDFRLAEGDFIAIMGPSGSGKSTLLNCLSSLDKPTSGNLRVMGQTTAGMSIDELSSFRQKDLGFIFQNNNLVSTLSIFDNIATSLILFKNDPQDTYKRVKEIAAKLHIEKILDKKPAECSGGEKQRASVARAIVNNPKILLCDEPTGSLDSQNSHELLVLLTELNKQGMSIILVTHDSMIASYAKKLVYLRDGQIKTIISKNNSSQEQFFNEIVKITTKDSLLQMFSDSSEDENK